MHPVTGWLGVSATQAVTTFGGLGFQYVPSWCQLMKVLSPTVLVNQVVPHTRKLGPRTLSTASRILGCVTISWTQFNTQCVSASTVYLMRGGSFSSRLRFISEYAL